MSEVFHAWSDFLEGTALLQVLAMDTIPEGVRMKLLRSVFEDGDDKHRAGLRLVLGLPTGDDGEIWHCIKRNDCRSILDRWRAAISAVPLVREPVVELVQQWDASWTELAAMAAATVFAERLSLAEVEKLTQRTQGKAPEEWEHVFEHAGHDFQYAKEDFRQSVFMQLKPRGHPLVMPVLFRDAWLPWRERGVDLAQVSQMTASGVAWLMYASVLELGISEALVCPVFRIADGVRTTLCHTEPSTDWCTLLGVVGHDREVDVSARGRVCPVFWSVVEAAIWRQMILVAAAKEGYGLGSLPGHAGFDADSVVVQHGSPRAQYPCTSNGVRVSRPERQSDGADDRGRVVFTGRVHFAQLGTAVATFGLRFASADWSLVMDAKGGQTLPRGIRREEAQNVIDKLPSEVYSAEQKKRMLQSVRSLSREDTIEYVVDTAGTAHAVESAEDYYFYLIRMAAGNRVGTTE